MSDSTLSVIDLWAIRKENMRSSDWRRLGSDALEQIAKKQFWPNVGPEGECLVWRTAPEGCYGRMWLNNRLTNAYVFSWLLHHGWLPPYGQTIDHLCANKRCVRHTHLAMCSRGENIKRGGYPHFQCSGWLD